MHTKTAKRWKSDTFEIQQSDASHYYWLMKATHREDRVPLTWLEVQELHGLLVRVIAAHEDMADETLAGEVRSV